MPNVERIQLWVNRLRDPASKQTTGRLADAHSVIPVNETTPMCCLGHACQVYFEVTGVGGWENGNFLGSNTVLPDEVREWFDLPKHDPMLNEPLLGESTKRSASWLNDSGHMSLLGIAGWVEATYLKD